MHLPLKSLVFAVFIGAAASAPSQTVTPIPKLDQGKFTGSWYEIARLPIRREKDCVRNVLFLVALSDKSNQLQLVNSCESAKHYIDIRNMTATSKKVPAELKVTTLFPFHMTIDIIAAAPDYSWAAVGSPNHKYLWIYAKTRAIDTETLTSIEAQTASEGFSISKIVLTPQNAPK